MRKPAKLRKLATWMDACREEFVGDLRGRLPPGVKSLFSAEDLYQQACLDGIRADGWLRHCHNPQEVRCMMGWAAERKLIAAIRYVEAKSRGGAPHPDEHGRVRVTLSDRPAGPEPVDRYRSPRTEIDNYETLTLLQNAVDDLPPDQRSAFTQRYVDGVMPKDIAAQTGKSAKAIDGLITRARKALQAALGDPSQYMKHAWRPRQRTPKK